MSLLNDKIYGSVIGSAIGDAMGGPVEGLSFQEIKSRFGILNDLLAYDEKRVNPHGPFSCDAGSYTDDTRVTIIFLRAAVRAEGIPLRGHIAEAVDDYYRKSETRLERAFIEEYRLKALHGEDKEAFGGRPTNGGIMGIGPLGLIFPCDPERAYEHVFRNLYFSTGSARSASALAAAVISAAMKPGADPLSAVDDALKAGAAYKNRVEGGYWQRSNLYPIVALKAEQLLEQAAELGAKYRDPFAFQDELYKLAVQPFFADAGETLALAAAMFTASGGDFEAAVTGCVNFGRDNDSSAAVCGAMAGALTGAESINSGWIETVESANPAPLPQNSLRELADILSAVVSRRIRRESAVMRFQEAVISEGGLPDIRQADEKGRTALHRAAAAGDEIGLKHLLAAGADVDEIDENETTALHFAAWENNCGCVKMLLDYGADPGKTEGEGWTALHDAVRREYTDIITLFAQRMDDSGCVSGGSRDFGLAELKGDERFLAILKLLKDLGVRLDSIGICGNGLLHDAEERGYKKAAAFLRFEGAQN